MNNEKGKTNYPLVDFLKLFFALIIMGHHLLLFGIDDLFTQIFVRLGVPFFFLNSSYFYAKKAYEDKENLAANTKAYVLRLLPILLVFESFGLGSLIYRLCQEGAPVADIVFKSIQAVIFDPPNATWYVQCLMISIVILYFAIKHNKEKIILPLGILFYAIGLLFNRYFFIVDGTPLGTAIDAILGIIATSRNPVFVGLFFCGIGLLLARKDVQSKGKEFPLTLFLSAFALYALEVLLTHGLPYRDDCGYFILTPFATASLFIFALQFKSERKTKTIRNLAASIYFLHRPICGLAEIVLVLSLNTAPSRLAIAALGSLIMGIFIAFAYKKKIKPILRIIT